MALIADALLISGAFAAAIYCWVLSRRLKGLENMDKGVGGAIASLNEQVGEMKIALRATQSVTGDSVSNLQTSTKKAEKVARRLEDYLSELDDLGVTAPAVKGAPSTGGANAGGVNTGAINKNPSEPTNITLPKSDGENAPDQVASKAGVAPKADLPADISAEEQADIRKRANRVDVRAPRGLNGQDTVNTGQSAQKADLSQSSAGNVQRPNKSNLALESAQKRAELQKQKSKLIAESGLSASEIEADEALIKAHGANAANVSALSDRRARKPLGSKSGLTNGQIINDGPAVSRSRSEQLQQDIKNRLEARMEGSDEDEFVKALQTVLAATTK